MYSSRGGGGGGGNYGQQSSYAASQTGYAQNLGSVYPGNSVGGPDSQQHSMASRHSSMLGASQEADTAAYRSHSSSTTHYGGQYGSVYSSAALGSKPQGPPLSAKGSGVPSALEGRGGYASVISDSPKYLSSDYISSSNHGYGHRTDPLFTEKDTEYPTLDRRQYNERQSAYLGRDLKTDAAGRFSESVGFGHQRHADSYDRVDQISLLRQEQLLKAQSQQSDPLDGSSRQNEYLAAKAAASRHSTQDLLSFGARIDADPRNVSVLNSSYSGQHSTSILGAAPRRNVDELVYFQSSSNPGYGVSLPPGRDYAVGKGLHGTSLESDYSGSMLTHSSHPRIDEHQDDRAGYLREFELREEERRRDRLHLREKERERDKAREREHEREREREREHERRERERDRERERERERERILERQKERDREFKRGLETRRERTPPRVSKDRRGSSLTKERRSLRRDSPHHEALHRRHSPVKEKRREYVCKVYPHRLVDLERDYLSLEKRYPRLFISPEFVKVIVNWPKEKLNLSIHTPVSFEHDFIDEEIVSGSKEISDVLKAREPVKSENVNVVWNVKIILMSGISRNALEELSSERSSEDRIPHFCNILRFAILKRDRSFMAIGGPWKSSDGGDPSVDDGVLVQTALRYAKDVSQLDLQNCHNWNRFLEIHYDRYNKDGVFSHKEVSVLFVPDLSDCLPSLNAWKEQWLAHKKTVAERERHAALKKEISKETKESMEVKEMELRKDSKSVDKSEKKEKIGKDVKEKSVKDDKANTSEGRGNGSSTKLESKDAAGKGKEALNVEKPDQGEVAGGTLKSGTVSSAKKKIVKKIVKQKAKTSGDSTSKKNDNLDEKVDGEKNSDIPSEPPSNDSAGAKTVARKRVIKRVGKSAQNEKNKDVLPKGENEMACIENKSKDNSELNASASQDTVVKTTVKKKVIKRVPKKKVTVVVSSEEASKKGDVDGHEKKATPDEILNVEKATTDDKQEKKIPKSKSTSPTSSKRVDSVNLKKAEREHIKNENETGKGISPVTSSVDKQKVGEKDSSGGKREKSRDGEQSKDEKEKMVKEESRSKPNKELKEKRKSEESPRHPGLILQTKWSKDSKFRSLSLSLDSLLEYTDKDIEEPTFELSLFAESLYEMLQFQMGSRILTFLQKLRGKFVAKRNQRKRQREVIHKEDKKSSPKRPKTVDISIENKSIEPEMSSRSQKDAITPAVEGNDLDGHVEEMKMETETEYSEEEPEEEPEEDPEEDPEEYEDLDDSSSLHNSSNENEANEEDATMGADEEDATMGADEEDAIMGANEEDASKGAAVEDAKTELNKEVKTAANEEPENVAANQADDAKGSNQESLSKEKTVSDKKGWAEEGMKKKRVSPPKEAVVDKELLQAFRFFDRNLVGYIRVEDMRMVIHNMGKFLSHRDVKELVHSALLESNTGRDDRILYGKLVRMSDL